MSLLRFVFAGAKRRTFVLGSGAVSLALLGLSATLNAQAPLPLPNTATTVAGGGGSIAAGAACPANGQLKSADTYGNGCPGLNTNFSTDTRGGIASDGQGNIYISDTGNNMIRKYDPKSGLVTRVAGKGTNCTAANGLLDSSGDGCPALQTSLTSTPRGLSADPYGNVLFAGYGTQMVHVVCEAASPLCPNTTGRKLVGYLYRVAGCVATAGSTATAGSGTSAGSEGDGTAASPFNNLAGDVAVNGGVAGNGTCSGTVGEVNQPRGIGGDKFGNVYIGETALGRWRVVLGPQTSSYFTGNNPLWAIVALNPNFPAPHQGYIYPLLNGFTAKTSGGITYNIPTGAGSACQTGAGASAATALDAYGDGCQYFATAVSGNTSSVQGITADNFGNVIIPDAVDSLVRVIYAGGANAAVNPMYQAIVANNPTVTPQAGFVYAIAGGGSTAISTTPTLGTATTLSNGIFKVTVGPGGDIYLGDSNGAGVQFIDISTGYIRTLFKSGTACAAHVTGSSNGDGCPAGAFSFVATNGFGVAVDPLANVYVLDQNALLRKIESVSLISTVVGSQTAAGAALTQTLKFHGPVGTASMTATALNSAADITLGSLSCGAANADGTMDCSVPVTFAPAQPGPRTLNLLVTELDGSSNVLGSQVFPVSGTGVGSALVADVNSPVTTSVAGITPVGAAVDGAGNVYFVDTAAGSVVKRSTAGSATTTVGASPAAPSNVAVDAVGNVYVTSATNANVTKFAPGAGGVYTSSALATGLTSPQAVVVDGNGNVFVADKSTGTVVEIAPDVYPNVQPAITIAAGFTNPVGLTIDGNGNIFVADSGAAGVFKIASVNGVFTTSLYAASGAVNVTATPGASASSVSPAVTISGLVPVAIASDAGGNVYVQDSASKRVITIPVSTSSSSAVTTLSGLTTPSGVAVDGSGVVYSADSGAQTLTVVARNAASYAFGTTSGTAAALGGYFGNAGNLAATGYAQTTSSEFLFDQTGTSTCGTIPSVSNVLNPGADCSFTAYFNPATSGNTVSSVTTLLAASSTVGSLTLTGQEPTGTTFATSINISAPSPASPLYVSSGTTASFTVTVGPTGTTDVPTGSVVVTTSCSGGGGSYALTNGSATVALSGCTAGAQTIGASYANTPDAATSGASFGASTGSSNFTVAQAGTQVSWTPVTTSQQFSAAVGASVLNAVATQASNGASVTGYYMYTATPSGGTASTIHAASYLPVGTYTLGVTFVPLDSVDFASSTATINNYTVTKANTAAGIGASQTVVAADGTGNFTTVQSAVNALGTAGGSVYIKPGTYSGSVTVVQPNVALRGLGGDPTAITLTHSGGAFGASSGVQMYAGEFTAATMNGAQLPAGSTVFTGDPGSATLVVSKGTNTAISPSPQIPNNFYAENFLVQNTYDSDTSTTTTTYLPAANSGNCTAGQGPPQTYNALFNQSLLCASQALAFYSTSDLAVVNNMYATSLQDTVCLGSCGSSAFGTPSRLYWFRGKITGSVDYIFGDGAAAFDYVSIYSMQNKGGGTGAAGTIHAQSKQTALGSGSDYLSGFVVNNGVLTSQTNNTFTDFGRPYGPYSTWIMLNTYVDEVMPVGYIEFSGKSNLSTSTFSEYNDVAYTTPANGTADLNGVTYTGSASYSGYGLLSTSTPPAARENTSQNPGTVLAANSVKTSMSAAQATLYYPAAFLGTPVSASYSSTTSWTPTATLAANVNAFVPSSTSMTVTYGDNVTILIRPQTPGLGAITNGSYTLPTGTYTVYDGGTVLASGSLDATGEAYLTTNTLAKGTHTLTWTYGGDANFNGSTTSTPLTITVNGQPTTTTLGLTASPITYGQSASLTAMVSATTGSPTGTVTATVDGGGAQTSSLSSGQAGFTFAGLMGGTHSFVGKYNGDSTYASSTSSALGLLVNPATLTATASCANRVYGAPNVCSASVTGYQYSDTASGVFTGTPTGATTAPRITTPGTYTASTVGSSLALTTFGSTNYTVSPQSSSFTVTGGAAQSILFAPLPNFASGHSYQLTAHATSGLPVTYSVSSGNATVSGSTLTVNGAGPVTVRATSTDPSGNYADAAAVSRSFTAQ